MPKNRVEELEATVAELESTVRGLTEELVETKERVRILEAEVDADPQSVMPETEQNVDLGDTESTAQSAARADIPESETKQTAIVTPTDDDPVTDETPEAGPEDVAEATKLATEDAAEASKSTEGEAGDDSEESEVGDDIIVA